MSCQSLLLLLRNILLITISLSILLINNATLLLVHCCTGRLVAQNRSGTSTILQSRGRERVSYYHTLVHDCSLTHTSSCSRVHDSAGHCMSCCVVTAPRHTGCMNCTEMPHLHGSVHEGGGPPVGHHLGGHLRTTSETRPGTRPGASLGVSHAFNYGHNDNNRRHRGQ